MGLRRASPGGDAHGRRNTKEKREVCFGNKRKAKSAVERKNTRREGTDVPIAIIRRAPDGDDGAVEHDLVALHGELVRARDEVERVVVREGFGDVAAEEEARAARGEAPACDVCRWGELGGSGEVTEEGDGTVGVGPEEVAHGSVVRDFLLTVNRAYLPHTMSKTVYQLTAHRTRTHLVHTRQIRTQAAMHAKDTAVDDSGEGEVVEDLAAVTPDVRGAVLALALVEEAVHLRDLPRLVVPPDERDPVGVSYFVGEQQEEGLDGVEPAVDEVACVCEMGGCE